MARRVNHPVSAETKAFSQSAARAEEKRRVEELPKCPRIVTTIEHPDQVIAIFRPALRHCGIVANDKVANRWDVLMLPADEDDAVAGKRIPHQCLLFALGKDGKGTSPNRSAIGVNVSSGRRLWLPTVTDLPLMITCFSPSQQRR
jgi:hypothetical protein